MIPTCQTCGTPLDGKRSGARYCSDACRQAACRARRAAKSAPDPLTRVTGIQAQPQPVVQIVREVVPVVDPGLVQRIEVLEAQLHQAQGAMTALERAAARAEDLRRLRREVRALATWREAAQPKIEEIERYLVRVIKDLKALQAGVAKLATAVGEYAEKRGWIG